jgi:uncharacterized protein
MASVQSATAWPRVRTVSSHRLSLWRTPRSRALLLLGTLGTLIGVVAVVARFYTELLWFREQGAVGAYLTTLKWKILAEGVVGLGTSCFVLVNLAIVERVAAVTGDRTGGRAVTALRRGRRLVYPLVALACGWVSVQSRPADTWQLLLLWANRTPFGVEDPVFHRDVGFFVFSLPLYREVAGWLLETGLMAVVASLAAYALMGAHERPRSAVARKVQAHMLALGALVLLVVAWRTRLAQLDLVLPHDGSRVPGASYTDIHVASPALAVLGLMAVLGAMLCFYATVKRPPLLLVVAVALLASAALVGKSELPALVERFDVQPQELTRERPQLAHAIDFTRRALALDRVHVRSLPDDGNLSAAGIRENRRTLDNVPLWDARVLKPALNDLQSIGQYYSFPSLTVDRYTLDGEPKVMTIAARQLDRRRLGEDGDGWATARFAYTHGYGVVAVGAAGADPSRPSSLVQSASAAQPNALGLRQPRIYYGAEAPGSRPPYVVVNSRRGEVDAPTSGSTAPGYHYDGSGGIPLSNRLRRLAFAARFADLRLLLTQTATDQSRIVVHPDARERLVTLAPFLRWDVHPQTAVVDGRVQFVFHGYTTSRNYPYAAPVRFGRHTFNYVRGAVVAAVDGFSGRVSIYVTDAGDPIARAWRGAYPHLFLPVSRMPETLQAQLRYPERLFAAQVQAYATYHADDPTAFWNGTDAWARPQQIAGPVEVAGEIHFPDREPSVDDGRRQDETAGDRQRTVKPGYLLARLPGDVRERFMLATGFTPRDGQNLVAYFAGSLDQRGRPRLTLLSLPRDQLTLGPTQATRKILADADVNRRLDLLNRESRDLGKAAVNRTIVGAPRTVPVDGTLAYVQPIYLAAGGSGLPRLQFVTVLANGRVGYGRTVRAALRRAG